ncbi:MAG: aspartate aminotransferase family protein [Patescibacteria group bacterium]
MDINLTEQQYVINTYTNRRLTLVRGDSEYLYDSNNEKYLDFMTNYGVNIFGYNNKTITLGLSDQLRQLTTLHGSFTNDIRSKASEAIIHRCGGLYSGVFWSNSGSEAIEAALKFAVLKSGKKNFIVCSDGYHGKTLGALSASGSLKYKEMFAPLLWDFKTIPFNDIKSLEATINTDTAAFIVEPIQGEGGINMPNKGFLKKVREICTKNNILLIIDEIQTGMGRTGTFLASSDIQADILCLGKGLGGGIPVGATIVTKEVKHFIPKHIHTSTFGGNPLSCRGVLETLKLLNSSRLSYINITGEYFIKSLLSIDSKYILDVRGKGLMIGLVVVPDKRDTILKLLQDRHILAIPASSNVVRFLPPFIIKKKDIDFLINNLEEIFNTL